MLTAFILQTYVSFEVRLQIRLMSHKINDNLVNDNYLEFQWLTSFYSDELLEPVPFY